VQNRNETVFNINTKTSDPSATIKSIQVTISQNTHWTVDVQPRIIYTAKQIQDNKMTNSTGDNASDDKLPIIIGAAVGGTVFVVCLIIGLCLLYRKKDNKHNSPSYSRL
jgi:Na+-translocating ferredoxin:NAD+ oxidoreductase RnfD subunit